MIFDLYAFASPIYLNLINEINVDFLKLFLDYKYFFKV